MLREAMDLRPVRGIDGGPYADRQMEPPARAAGGKPLERPPPVPAGRWWTTSQADAMTTAIRPIWTPVPLRRPSVEDYNRVFGLTRELDGDRRP